MVQIMERGRPIDDEDIAVVESVLNVRLPDSYRNFLLAYNGGRPSPDVVDVDMAPGSPTDVQVFFGIERGVATSDLLWNVHHLSARLPSRDLLPIACDSGGNLFCLSVSGNSVGKIFYCDLSTPTPKAYLVAQHLEDFLDKLRAWDGSIG